MTKSVEFFETQFRRQVANGDSALNPFEAAALPYLRGRVLDFGCGLGNLAVAAARQGCSVLALDASATAVRHAAAKAAQEGLAIEVVEADLRTYALGEDFDSVVSIGLLMFFDCATAHRQLDQLKARVRPEGLAAINVLIEGTTYLDMFDPAAYCLFGRGELRKAFAGWEILSETLQDFPAPGGAVKAFATIVARNRPPSEPKG